MNKDKLISIHLNSNKPKEFLKFIESIVINTKEISNIEVIVSIDQKDLKMIKIINEINKEFPNLIRYIETDLIQTFADAWKPLNKLLLKTTDSVKYISCMSDNVRFKTKNWDQKFCCMKTIIKIIFLEFGAQNIEMLYIKIFGSADISQTHIHFIQKNG